MNADFSTYALQSFKGSNGAAQEKRMEQLGSAMKGGSSEEEIDRVAKDFEAVFISQMLRHMFGDVGKEGLMHGGNAEEMWRDMLTEEYGKVVAGAGGIGIAPHVKAELTKLQEVSGGQ
jgi:flagellar protein FlgJ